MLIVTPKIVHMDVKCTEGNLKNTTQENQNKNTLNMPHLYLYKFNLLGL